MKFSNILYIFLFLTVTQVKSQPLWKVSFSYDDTINNPFGLNFLHLNFIPNDTLTSLVVNFGETHFESKFPNRPWERIDVSWLDRVSGLKKIKDTTKYEVYFDLFGYYMKDTNDIILSMKNGGELLIRLKIIAQDSTFYSDYLNLKIPSLKGEDVEAMYYLKSQHNFKNNISQLTFPYPGLNFRLLPLCNYVIENYPNSNISVVCKLRLGGRSCTQSQINPEAKYLAWTYFNDIKGSLMPLVIRLIKVYSRVCPE